MRCIFRIGTSVLFALNSDSVLGMPIDISASGIEGFCVVVATDILRTVYSSVTTTRQTMKRVAFVSSRHSWPFSTLP